MSDYEQNSGYLRFRYRRLGPDGEDAVAQYMSLAPALPLGHYQLTVGASPEPLPSIPPYCRRVVIVSLTAALTFTDKEGQEPGASLGMVIPRNVVFTYDTDPDEHFKMWCPTASDVRIAYYG